MVEVDYAQLQQQYGGRYVARRGCQVIASAETYDALADELESREMNWSDLIIEYIEPADTVCVY